MRKAAPIILIAGFAAFLLYMLTGLQTVQETAPGPITLPDQVGGFKQTLLASGEEGMLAFARQHKKRIPIKQGAMGTYSDGTSQVDLWIANGAGPTHAHQLFMEMAATIGPENPIFSKPTPVDLEMVQGYRTVGQEAVNFFFTKDGRVYWIAVRGGNPDEAVKLFMTELLTSGTGANPS